MNVASSTVISTELDVFLENFTLIDWQLYDLWIAGAGVSEAVTVMRDRGVLNEYPGVTQDLLISDVGHNYRLFSALEQVLLDVGCFHDQTKYQLDSETQTQLIERYYSLNPVFAREIIGKKLSSRTRKDLDDISEKTGVNLRSCRRQFDNVKRVFKSVEEMPGDFTSNIIRVFHMSRPLAESYSAIVFLAAFKVETGKKKLASLPFESFKESSLKIIEDWLEVADSDNEPSLDKDFFSSLKHDLKVLNGAEKEKELRNAICAKLSTSTENDANTSSPGQSFSQRSYSEIENNFKAINRNLISLGQNLSSNKDLKDFFILLTEKLIEPFQSMKLDKAEVKCFLETYTQVLEETFLVEQNIRQSLLRFMKTLTPCIIAVYGR